MTLIDTIGSVARRPPVRLAIQAGTAALVTYVVSYALGMREQSWAVISTLFVLQGSVGGTIGAAVGRIVGALIGIALGLAWIHLGGTRSAVLTAVGVVAGGMITTYIAGIKPTLRYGAVTVAIMIIAPGADPVERAWQRGAAIALGVVVGALCSLLVFPRLAHRGAEAEIGRAIRRCGDLLAASLKGLTGRDAETLSTIQGDIRGALDQAQAMAGQTKVRKLHPRSGQPELGTLLRAVERLWHSLILIDRADVAPLADLPRRRLEPALDAAAEGYCGYLATLADAAASGKAPPPPTDLGRHQDALRRTFDRLRHEITAASLSTREAERVFALSFAFDQVHRNIEDLAGLLGAPTERRDPANDAPTRQPGDAA